MRILMTGCSSGFGKTVRENLQSQGHEVFGVGINGPDLYEDFRSWIYARDDMAAQQIVEKAGPCTALICNAGTTTVDFLQHHTSDMFTDVLAVNLVAPFALTRQFFLQNVITAEKERKFSWKFKVIYTSSMASKFAMRASPGYCASKAGLEAMCRVFAKEWAGKSPRCMSLCIAPGTVAETQMSTQVIQELMRTRGMSETEAIKYSLQSPLGRAATHDEVWKVFDFAVNHAPEFMSGETIYMPAGMGI